MALICTTNAAGTHLGGWMAIACGNDLLVASESEAYDIGDGANVVDGIVRLGVDHSPISCSAFSPSNTLLAACSDEKKLMVWRTGSWSVVTERVVPKRATALQFTSDDEYILVSDKAGDLYRYALSDSTSSGEHLLGHFSMLLDMVLSPSNSHVITCDRDEKIRVSKYPNSYNIETYCLAHTDFVSRICLSRSWPNLLLSTSGDGTLKCWEWEEGKLLDTAVCSRPRPTEDWPKALTKLTCSRSCDAGGRSKIVVAMKTCDLLVFDLSSTGQLTPCDDSTISVATSPWSCEFDSSDRLWVCLPHEPEPLLCYKLDGSKLLKVNDVSLLKRLGKWSLLKGAVGQEKDWNQLRKQVYDNMSAYLARKEERIRSKVVESTNKLPEHDLFSEPPDKKIKIANE